MVTYFTWFFSLEDMILGIHERVYKGNRDKNRYRIGDYVFEVNHGRLFAVHNLKTKHTIQVFQDELQIKKDEKVSSLAEDVESLLESAIQNITPLEVYVLLVKAQAANLNWINLRFNHIISHVLKGTTP